MNSRLAGKILIVVPPPPPRFTLSEWQLNNRLHYQNIEQQQQLADQIVIECKTLAEKSAEVAELNKRETNYHIDTRIQDIEFNKSETERQRKEALLEIDALLTYVARISDAALAVKDEALHLCQNCIILREGRLGIDLVHDAVERELLKEVGVIKGAQALLKKLLEQVTEQVRRLRSTIYFLDRDLQDKSNALKLDNHNKNLTNTSLNLSMYHGKQNLANSNISLEEWTSITSHHFYSVAKEITSAISIRTYADLILKQCIEDLWNQYYVVNDAFQKRIEETKAVKSKLEIKHYEICTQVTAITKSITELEKAISEKEGYLALAHTRLGNRCQRNELELCKDHVETRLVHEVQSLRENIAALQQMICEAQASLRYLLKSQIQIEEDINVKTNSLKIDEVDCLTLRDRMNYNSY